MWLLCASARICSRRPTVVLSSVKLCCRQLSTTQMCVCLCECVCTLCVCVCVCVCVCPCTFVDACVWITGSDFTVSAYKIFFGQLSVNMWKRRSLQIILLSFVRCMWFLTILSHFKFLLDNMWAKFIPGCHVKPVFHTSVFARLFEVFICVFN